MKNSFKTIALALSLMISVQLFGQNEGVSINVTNDPPNASAMLDVSHNSKGILIPRMSSVQRTAILSAATGLMVYDIDTKSFWYFDIAWKEIITNSKETDPGFASSEAKKITSAGSGKVITDTERTKLNNLSASTDTFKINTRYVDKTGLIMPAGTILAYAGNVLPNGWLWCNGDPQSATKYHDLFDAIGYAWGGAADLFNVPDLRGQFLRGVDGAANVDPDKLLRTKIDGTTVIGNVLGSYQSDIFKLHAHTASVSSSSTISVSGTTGDGSHSHSRTGYFASGAGGSSSGDYVLYNTDGSAVSWSIGGGAHTHSLSGTGTHPSHSATIDDFGGNETRPKNVYVNYIIKY